MTKTMQEHIKCIYTYKLNYSKTVKHNKSFLKALNNRTKRAKLWTWLLILP